MSGFQHELTESKEIDVVDDDAMRPLRRRGQTLTDREAYDELKKKYDELKKKFESLKERCCFIERRENSSPLAILLFILNDQRLSANVYDILESDDGLNLVTQCKMLLHKNEAIVHNELDRLPTLLSKDKEIIKSAIRYYHEIITDSIGAHRESIAKFLFSIIWNSIERSGRIQCVVTTRFWQCIHYLTIFLYDAVPDFERYISRYVPLKLPASIIDDVSSKYHYIFAHASFDNELRTLKDVIHSLLESQTTRDRAKPTKSPQEEMVHASSDGDEEEKQQKPPAKETKANGTDSPDTNDNDHAISMETDECRIAANDNEVMDDSETFNPLDEADTLALLVLQRQQEAESLFNGINDINDDHNPDLNPNAEDFVPTPSNMDSNVNRLSTIREEDEMPEIGMEITSPVTTSAMCNVSPLPLLTSSDEDGMNDANEECKSHGKSTRNKPKPQRIKPIANFNPKSGNRSRSNFFISRAKITQLASQCMEVFATDKINDSGLVFDYFKNSAAMQINDKQMDRTFTTGKGLMLILNIDLHFKEGGHKMYLIAFENDIAFRHRVPWCIDGFRSAQAIYKEYGVRTHELPKSSRDMRWCREGIANAPYDIPLEVITRTNFTQLKTKSTKQRKAVGFVKMKPKLRMRETDLKRFVQQSWYNGVMIPAVVIKGKKQCIEWKKIIKIYDERGMEQWIGISLRYYKSNKQWKIECMEYDPGRIYYQHRLVAMHGSSPHHYSFRQIHRYRFIERSLDIV